MFWGLVVQPNKKYSKTVSTPFHVSQAVLDITSTTGDADVQLILKSDKVDYILCILNKSATVQVPLNLIFSEGDEISFRSVGGTVHLTGYLVDEQSFTDLDEDASSDEEAPQLVAAPKSKGKQEVTQESSTENEESEGSEDEAGSDDEDDGEGIVDADSDDDAMEDSDDDEIAPPQPKKAKKIGMSNGVPENGVKSKDSKHKKPQQKPEEAAPPSNVRKISGGVVLQDLREGKGPAVKTGKKVQVYYEGRHESTNKIFDKTNSGKGFEFVVGRGNVIKAWDLGIVGMKVGGKRRITCPPGMAYGAKGSPPAIPPNATLIFDVELRHVH